MKMNLGSPYTGELKFCQNTLYDCKFLGYTSLIK